MSKSSADPLPGVETGSQSHNFQVGLFFLDSSQQSRAWKWLTFCYLLLKWKRTALAIVSTYASGISFWNCRLVKISKRLCHTMGLCYPFNSIGYLGYLIVVIKKVDKMIDRSTMFIAEVCSSLTLISNRNSGLYSSDFQYVLCNGVLLFIWMHFLLKICVQCVILNQKQISRVLYLTVLTFHLWRVRNREYQALLVRVDWLTCSLLISELLLKRNCKGTLALGFGIKVTVGWELNPIQRDFIEWWIRTDLQWAGWLYV